MTTRDSGRERLRPAVAASSGGWHPRPPCFCLGGSLATSAHCPLTRTSPTAPTDCRGPGPSEGHAGGGWGPQASVASCKQEGLGGSFVPRPFAATSSVLFPSEEALVSVSQGGIVLVRAILTSCNWGKL